MTGSDGQQLTFQRLSETQFSEMKPEWTTLHASSGESVFTSWPWMYAWWQTFKKEDYELCLVACHSQNKLVAILPFYSVKEPLFKYVRVKRLRVLGDGGGYRAEYLGFICSSDYSRVVAREAVLYLTKALGAAEILFAGVGDGEDLQYAIQNVKSLSCGYVRETARDSTYNILLNTDYGKYLEGLGKGTRYRVTTSEKRLAEKGVVDIHEIPYKSVQERLKVMQSLHANRWDNERHFSSYQNFLECLVGLGSEVELSGVDLSLDGEVIGSTLNVCYQGVVSNLMLGFRSLNIKRVSVGLLAISKDIEQHVETDKFETYDLLAGTGKSTNYKEKLAGRGKDIVSLQLCISPWLHLVYRTYDWLQYLKVSVLSSKRS